MEKLLDWENSHLYNKLGLRWKLARQRCDSTLMMEYVSTSKEYLALENECGSSSFPVSLWPLFPKHIMPQ